MYARRTEEISGRGFRSPAKQTVQNFVCATKIGVEYVLDEKNDFLGTGIVIFLETIIFGLLLLLPSQRAGSFVIVLMHATVLETLASFF